MAALPVHVSANVWIGVDTKKREVIPKEQKISVGGRHEVEWYCHDATKNIIVRFPTKGEKKGEHYNGSPFAASEFRVPPGGSVCSGPPAETSVCGLCSKPPDTSAATHLHYKYDVYEVTPEGKEALVVDPMIIIIRP